MNYFPKDRRPVDNESVLSSSSQRMKNIGLLLVMTENGKK